MGILKKSGKWLIDYYTKSPTGRITRHREIIGACEGAGKISPFVVREILARRKFESKFPENTAPNAILLNEAVKLYFAYSRANKAPSTYALDLCFITNFVKFILSRSKSKKNIILAEAVTPAILEKFKEHRMTSLKPASIGREMNCIGAFLKKLIEWGYLKENPMAKIKKPRKEPARIRYLTFEEMPILIKECAPHLRPIVFLALNTGMRKGEILGLLWENVDFDNNIIHVILSLAGNPKGGYRRDIPMSDRVKEMLAGLPRKNKYVFGGAKEIKGGFSAACRRAGIKNFHFHDLRHTFASQMIMSGIDLTTVKELLGHQNIEMTMRYAHLSPDHRRAAIDRFSQKLGGIWTTAKNENPVRVDK